MSPQPTPSALSGFSRTPFAPVTGKEARLPLLKAGVNVCRRCDTCSSRTCRESPAVPEEAAHPQAQLIAAGRRHTEAAGRNREG